MARTIFNNPSLPRSNSPHSNAVRVGNLLFVSGFPGYDENVKGDFPTQMRQALKHIRATLEYAGSSIEKIAKVNVYLDRRADFDEMNDIYKEFFGTDPSQWPARTTIEARLPRKDSCWRSIASPRHDPLKRLSPFAGVIVRDRFLVAARYSECRGLQRTSALAAA